MAQAYQSRRTLGDKLQTLARLCEQDVHDIETIVDYRIQTLHEAGQQNIRDAARGRPEVKGDA